MLKAVLKYITFSFLVLFSKALICGPDKSFDNDPTGLLVIKSENHGEAISKKQLVKIIDSLLDLNTIDAKEIELVNYYNSLLNNTIESEKTSKEIQLSSLNFYENLDESIIFPPTPPSVLNEEEVLEIESDGLSYYTHPKAGPVTSYYGWRDKQMHKGIDIDLEKGQPVVAAFDGKVRIAKRRGGYGNVVVLMHPNGLETVYAHLSKFKVKQGDVVLSGQTIGLGGSTGHSTGSHLHFEIRYKGIALNPSTCISFDENKLLYNSIVIKKSRYGFCAFPSNSTFHSVEKGDNWTSLAKKYGLTTKQLYALNGIQKRYYLKVGQKIRIS